MPYKYEVWEKECQLAFPVSLGEEKRKVSETFRAIAAGRTI